MCFPRCLAYDWEWTIRASLPLLINMLVAPLVLLVAGILASFYTQLEYISALSITELFVYLRVANSIRTQSPT